MFISVFDYVCLNGCHPPEMQRCWHKGRLIKLLTLCLPGRKSDQSFFRAFLLFPFTNWPNIFWNTCIIVCARRKRLPLVPSQSRRWIKFCELQLKRLVQFNEKIGLKFYVCVPDEIFLCILVH